MKIGVIVDSLRMDLYSGIQKAREMGAEGLQMNATSGEMAPEHLSARKRREILDFIRSQGMVVAALCGDLGGHGFAMAQDNPEIGKSKRIMDLAKDLACDIITSHIGVIPEDENHPRRAVLYEACRELAEYGKSMSASFAIETGPEPASVLKRFLDSINMRGISVNFDPANFVMVTGDDPVQAVKTLSPYIVHTHAKDGVMLKQESPEIIYNYFAEGNIEDPRLSAYFQEKPLGAGAVRFPDYLDALQVTGYSGFLTIEKETGPNPVDEIAEAILYLRRQLI